MTTPNEPMRMLAPSSFRQALSRRALFQIGGAAAGLAIIGAACGSDDKSTDTTAAGGTDTTARIIAQAAGHKPSPDLAYAAPPVFLFEPHQPEQCDFKPNVILNIDEVWEVKRRAFEVLAAQKHLWEYYTRVALNRGMQGGRNSGKGMTYGEAYQRLFPMVVETLA